VTGRWQHRTGVPVAPAVAVTAGVELLVRGKRVDQRCGRVAPVAVVTLEAVGVKAMVAVEVEERVLPVAGLEHPVKHHVVVSSNNCSTAKVCGHTVHTRVKV